MISNFTLKELPSIPYPITDSSLPFPEYIARCKNIIEKHRVDLQSMNSPLIVASNSPYELYPANPLRSETRLKYGVLLVHGLLDCPFSVRDIGAHLQSQGMLCRSILLPGHGTKPSDLCKVTYQDWIQAVRYGINSLRQEVDKIFLVGYSTGAALSIYHALHDANIAGLVLIAPAIKIKIPEDLIVSWHYFRKLFRDDNEWLYCEKEIDYARYLSVAFNPVNQLNKLTDIVDGLNKQSPLQCPIYLVVSQEDETISSHSAIDFFTSSQNAHNKMLLYTSHNNDRSDSRILIRKTNYPELNIKHFSHVSIPFAPNNYHYGQDGDYQHASHRYEEYVYGAYSPLQINAYDWAYRLRLIRHKRSELTYNPDFSFMAEKISDFILSL